MVYLESVRFDPDDPDIGRVEDPPAELLGHRGEVGQLFVAFVANGMVHFWRQCSGWRAEWEKLADAAQSRRSSYLFGDEPSEEVPAAGGGDEPERMSEQDRARVVGELVAQLLADPQFRAAKPGGARQRYARLAAGEGVESWVGYMVARDASDQADLLAQAQYSRLTERLDDLAAELLTDGEYRKASSAGAKKQAAERFLTPRADGFAPPAIVRDELYARAQELAKARRRGLGGQSQTLL